jgi:ABC-type cobalamin transport system permease subunit
MRKAVKLLKPSICFSWTISISDVYDLRLAVMSWMWGKFNEDWTNQYEVIESLPR